VLALASVVSLSRVFVGAHFPRDVLGGVIVSLALFYLFVRFAWSRWEPRIPLRPRFNNWGFRAAFDLELLGALFVMFVYAPRFADEWAFLTSVALGVLGVLAWGWVSAHRATPPV
jgi:small-conductance mechanosensitive channel